MSVSAQRARIAGVLSASAVSLTMPVAHGAQWSAEGRMSADLEHHSNLQLEATDPLDVTGALIGLIGTLGVRSESQELTAAPRMLLRRYDGGENLDANDYSLVMNYNVGRDTSRWHLDGSLANESTLTTELEDTGLVDVQKRREAIAFNGSVDWAATERDVVTMQVGDQANHYIDAASSGLIDYVYLGGLLAFNHSIDQRSSFGARFSGGSMKPAELFPASHDVAARLTFMRQFSPTYRLNLEAGVSRADSQGLADDGTVYLLDLERTGLLTDWHFAASREVVPSGAGSLTRREEGVFTLSRRLAPLWRMAVSLRHLLSEELQGSTRGTQRNYDRAELSCEWRLAQYWALSGAVSYATQNYSGPSPATDDLTYGIGLTWTPPAQAMSR
ncbi:MAG TPA: hypothetical protein VEZ88_03495 [Steroidobacteraceae bacterium]|nr:hypothetical protein [Steroidobacteraceae bacterium]